MGMIRSELKQSGTIKLGSASVRKLAGIPSGAIPMGMLRGKSLETWLNLHITSKFSLFLYNYVGTVLHPNTNQYGEPVITITSNHPYRYGTEICKVEMDIKSPYKGNLICLFKDGNSSISIELGWYYPSGYSTTNKSGYLLWRWMEARKDKTVQFKMKRK